MYCIIDKTTDPYRNLAAEEYLLKHIDEPVFRLWRNDRSVIVGKNQNTIAEIDSDFVTQNNIPVVRRLTGGGAVFHDLGNINFTFIDKRIEGEDTGAMFRRFTSPIIAALNSLGVKAYLEGRNDLLIDGKKFSGNAICIHKNRVLQHGTLLFSSSMGDLSGALRSRPEKFVGKSVQSNRSRVTNISDHLPVKMDVLEFLNYLREYIGKEHTPYNYTDKDNEVIEGLRATKYSTIEWNYGNSPDYSFSKVAKFPSGLIELFFNVEKGIISNIEIKGDYFFKAPTEEFCAKLIDVPHTKEKITDCLGEIAVDDYFTGISSEELAGLFF